MVENLGIPPLLNKISTLVCFGDTLKHDLNHN